MALACRKCARANPPDASYCYFDGIALDGHVNGGAVPVSKRVFPNEFVFPSGRSCKSFDELAVACQERWQEARDLLKQGFLESFLGSLGRADLALAAREAARFPDHDRGLDQLLNKIPSQVLEPPKLHAEPLEISLGTLKVGQDREFQITLENQGMRLLFGSVTVEDCPWLALGDKPGAPEKLFQFGSDTKITVHVRGNRLRASAKPLEGRLVVDSNGGQAVIIVKAEVPVKPFPEGVLAGALAPRKIAEKAKASPKEAAALFEKGLVEKWYKENGWDYPVQVPVASGIATVQQFFEALGLTAPPKVDISERAVKLPCNPGTVVRHKLDVKSQEKRPVWAHAVSDQTWLQVGRTVLNGRVATIPLTVPSVPNQPGQLTAKVTVTANGGQRFVVPVTLMIAESLNFTNPPPIPIIEEVTAAAPVQALEPMEVAQVDAAAEEPFFHQAAIAAAPTPAAPAPAEEEVFAAAIPSRTGSRRSGSYSRASGGGGGGAPNMLHAIPAFVLALIVCVIGAFDLLTRTEDKKPPDDTGNPFGQGDDDNKKGQPSPAKTKEDYFKQMMANLKDSTPYLAFGYQKETQRFGLVCTQQKDARGELKRLTSTDTGGNNNTCIRIDGSDYLVGATTGSTPKGFPEHKTDPERWTTMWTASNGKDIMVTQEVMLVRGDSGLLDTVLIVYTVKNKSTLPRQVGLRAMIDTYIGARDDVPFMVPGHKPTSLVDDIAEIKKLEIPDYITAIETGDPTAPGTSASFGLKGFHVPWIEQLEPIDHVVLCRWPEEIGGGEVRWDWKYEKINENPARPDSCIVLYWPYVKMNGGETRYMAFTIGLGAFSGQEGPPPADPAAPRVAMKKLPGARIGDKFTVTGYIKNPRPDLSKVELSVPDGLKLVSDKAQEIKMKPGDPYAQVSWTVEAEKTGDNYAVEMSYGPAKVDQKMSVTKNKSIVE